MRSRQREAGRLYEIPCLVVVVLVGLAVVVPGVVKLFREKPGSGVAPVGSAATVGSGS